MSSKETEQGGGPWLDYEAAAEHTTLSAAFLRRLVMQDRIPYQKIGRRVLFSVPMLDQWVRNNGAMVEGEREKVAV